MRRRRPEKRQWKGESWLAERIPRHTCTLLSCTAFGQCRLAGWGKCVESLWKAQDMQLSAEDRNCCVALVDAGHLPAPSSEL